MNGPWHINNSSWFILTFGCLPLKMSFPWFLVLFFYHLWLKQIGEKNNLIEPLKAAEVPRTADTACVSATFQRFDSQWQFLKISLTLKWCNCQKQNYSSLAILMVTFFGMVKKLPFEMVKWPPIRGWKGHFESPGTLLFHVHCWILSPFFLKDLTEWPTAQSSYFPPKTSGNTDSLNHPPPIFHIAPEKWCLDPSAFSKVGARCNFSGPKLLLNSISFPRATPPSGWECLPPSLEKHLGVGNTRKRRHVCKPEKKNGLTLPGATVLGDPIWHGKIP